MAISRGLRHYLKSGGLIAYPTESCFGLGCDPHNRHAVRRLLRLKRRPQHKGLILIADTQARLTPFITTITPAQQAQLDAGWPGPNTWLIPATRHCPVWLRGRHASIAVRVTAHPTAAALAHHSGMALVSTSANRSGCQPAKSTRECYRRFGNSVRVIAGQTGRRRKPSTIRDIVSGCTLRG